MLNLGFSNSLVSSLRHYLKSNAKDFERAYYQMEEGSKMFQRINSFRMNIALENFSRDMLFALFEILFFLHVNDPKYANYSSKRSGDEQKPNNQSKEDIVQSCLYVENALTGVAGIHNLDKWLDKYFRKYIASAFGVTELNKNPYDHYLSICSIGSIGTIAHKPGKSDLDIQIQYEIFDPNPNSNDIKDSEIQNILNEFGRSSGEESVQKMYPILYSHFSDRNNFSITKDSLSEKPQIFFDTVFEIENLLKTHLYLTRKQEILKIESACQKKFTLLGNHILDKFPSTDVFFFAYPTDLYRRGKHGNTKKSKEASGSAYELIINYDTLLPGIQFNPIIPTHYLFSEDINESEKKYKYYMSLLRLGLSDEFKRMRGRVVDLGNTPKLDKDYASSHTSAVYWEAFKASQGNLPKAFLNLLRIETLIWLEKSPTVINVIKNRDLFHREMNEAESDRFGLNIPPNKTFTLDDIAAAEKKFFNLNYDPWWIRYKILKFSYESPPGVINPFESKKILELIDLCFAIHIWLAEVIEEDSKSDSKDSYRKKFMTFFLNNAFPPFSENRIKIEKVFLGDVNTITSLEREIKSYFHNCIKRVEYFSKHTAEEVTQQREEWNIWFHYFEKFFTPPNNMIPRTILKNPKNNRNKLKIEFKDKFWFYNAIYEKDQKNMVEFAPGDEQFSEIELHKNQNFIAGLAFCIQNGYYKFSQGTAIVKTLTSIVMKQNRFNEDHDKSISSLRSDALDSIGTTINQNFKPFPVDYRECINENISTVNICIFLNLMMFGRVDKLYRDSLDNWYYTGTLISSVRSKSKILFDHPDKFYADPELLKHVASFCSGKNIKPENLDTVLNVWINPTSLKVTGNTTAEKLALHSNRFLHFFKPYYNKYLQVEASNKDVAKPDVNLKIKPEDPPRKKSVI